MSGSRWVIIPSWLFESWRSYLYSSSVYSCHLFLISSASVRSILFLSFTVPIFAWNIFGISNFLEENSSLSHSIVFLYFFALTTEEGFLISPCYSLEVCIQMGISFLFSFAFSFSLLIFQVYNIPGSKWGYWVTKPRILTPFSLKGTWISQRNGWL